VVEMKREDDAEEEEEEEDGEEYVDLVSSVTKDGRLG
jgi:hypothetical protein